MTFFGWWAWLVGYLDVEVQGPWPERFLNLCLSRGVAVWDATPTASGIRVCIEYPAVRALRPLARQARCRLHIRARHGLPFAGRPLRGRVAFAMGAALFMAAMVFATHVVWAVRVSGGDPALDAQVRAMAAALGVYPGAVVDRIDPTAIRQELLARVPGLAAAAVNVTGIVATVVVVPRLLPPPSALGSGPGPVVADRAGLVLGTTVWRGTAVVQPGQLVTPGQVLISGEIGGDLGATGLSGLPVTPLAVRARGAVLALVWHVAEIRQPLLVTDTTLTGRVAVRLGVRVNGRQVLELGPGGNPFGAESVASSTVLAAGRTALGSVELQRSVYRQVRAVTERLTVQQAQARAVAEATALLARQLPVGAEVRKVGFWLVAADQQAVTVVVWLESAENIARDGGT